MLSELYVFSNMLENRLPLIVLIVFCLTGSVAHAEPLSGLLLESDRQFTEALQQYEIEVEAIQTEHGVFNYRLIEPLMGIARIQFSQGDLEAATESIHRAQHVSHRQDGVHSLRQLEGTELLTRIFLAEDKPLLADKQQRFAYYISAQAHEPDSLEVLPALEKLADWYTKTGQLHRARKLNERGIEIVENHFGEDSIQQLPYLQQLAKLKRLQRVCCSTRVMEQALTLIDNNPNIDNNLKANTYLQVADAYIASGSRNDAELYYQKAWTHMTPSQQVANFSKPKRIVFSKPLNNSALSDAKIFRPDRDRFGSRDLRPLSSDELRSFSSVPPQEFVVTENDSDYNIRIRDRTVNNGFDTEPTMRTVGKPFTFLHAQLLQILPTRFQRDEVLSQVSLDIVFEVDAKGRAHNIRVLQSDVPGKLTRLMRDVVRKTRFRPKMENGVLVATPEHQLTQTFLLGTNYANNK